MPDANYLNIARDLLVSVVLGLLVGLERQFHDQVAGIRTMSLVSLGACAFVSFSFLTDVGDQSRIAAQVVSGIGFLGAGVIIHDGLSVRGLTTAATMWCTAAIGALAGGGHYAAAGMFTAGILVVNTAIRPISKKIANIHENNLAELRYSVKVVCHMSFQFDIRQALIKMIEENGFQIFNMEASQADEEIALVVEISTHTKSNSAENIVRSLAVCDGVVSVSRQLLKNR